jgi:hypothetical protein
MTKPNFKKDEFAFPDEIEDNIEIEVEGDEVDIEVVDDTPEDDRNVEPLTEDVVEELETADEKAEYSKNVKTKFKQYKKAWHDERREKEAALREQQEALTMAQKILDENKRLKTMLQSGEKELITTYQTSADLELEKAKRNYKEAYDSGDSDKLLEAQEEMLAASFKVDKAKNFKPTVQVEENDVQIAHKQVQQPQMDSKTAEWLTENPWFVDPDKDYMSAFARRVHNKLAEQYGQSYVGTDAYYKAINKEVQRKFPDEFDDIEPQNDEPKAQRTQKLSTVVAPAKRSTASKKVVLTRTQIALAKRFNLTPEQYARELTKLEA